MKSIFLKIFFLELASAVFCVVLQKGYGRGDISAFAIWAAFYAFVFSLIGLSLIRKTTSWSSWVQGIALFFAVAALSLLWGRLVQIFLGMWFGLFSFPVALCWLAGGVAGTLFHALVTDRKKSRKIWLAGCLGALSFALVLPPTVAHYSYYLTGGRAIDVTIYRLRLGKGPLQELPDGLNAPLSTTEMAQLRELGISGSIELGAGDKTGKGWPTKIIIVASEIPSRTIKIPLIEHGNAIYYQTGRDEFKVFPTEVKFTKDVIEIVPSAIDLKIEPPGRQANGLNFWILDMGLHVRFD